MFLGVTGGIGSGKSTFAAMLAERGAVVIDADELARAALAPGSSIIDQVAAQFPGVVVDGAVNRAQLAELIFADDTARARLEALVHPEVARLLDAAKAAAGPESLVVYDVPLLVEKAMQDRFDAVVVVVAPLEDRLARLTARGLSREDALARMATQATDEQRAAVADFLVNNDGTLADLSLQADNVLAALAA